MLLQLHKMGHMKAMALRAACDATRFRGNIKPQDGGRATMTKNASQVVQFTTRIHY